MELDYSCKGKLAGNPSFLLCPAEDPTPVTCLTTNHYGADSGGSTAAGFAVTGNHSSDSTGSHADSHVVVDGGDVYGWGNDHWDWRNAMGEACVSDTPTLIRSLIGKPVAKVSTIIG